MDRPGSMDLFHTPAQDVLEMNLELATWGFRLPGGHQGSKDELSVVRELEAECPRSHGLTRRQLERLSLPVVPVLTYLHFC
jgi:hypothetical protein